MVLGVSRLLCSESERPRAEKNMALGLIFCLIFCYRAAIFDSKEKDSKGIQKSSPGAECKMKEF